MKQSIDILAAFILAALMEIRCKQTEVCGISLNIIVCVWMFHLRPVTSPRIASDHKTP